MEFLLYFSESCPGGSFAVSLTETISISELSRLSKNNLSPILRTMISQGLTEREAHMRVAKIESVAKTWPLCRNSRMRGSSVVVSAQVLKFLSAADFFIGRSVFGVIRSH